MADERNISLFVWINPYNQVVSELAEKMIKDEVKLLRQKIASRFRNFVDLSMQYPDADYYWKSDPFHYYPSTGELFFRENISGNINSQYPD